MAENKKSFILYADLIHTAEELTDEEAGKLFKHILRYVNDKNPDAPDRITKIAFEPVKQQLKRDLQKYESIKSKRSLAGKASAETRQQNQHMSTSDDTCSICSTNPTVNDNVNVNVNVNEREKEISLPPEIKKKIENSSEKVINETFSIISKDDRWIEVIAINNHLRPKQKVIEYLNAFYKKLENEGTVMKSVNDAKSHFARWLNIELNKQ